MPSYQVAPIFLIRLAGAPFEIYEQLATRDTNKAARELLVRQDKLSAQDETRLAVLLEHQLSAARSALLEAARTLLPAYLLFASAELRHNLLNQSMPLDSGSLPARNSRARERERHLLLYLQRIAAKNDTFSEFGPTGWGKIDQQIR